MSRLSTLFRWQPAQQWEGYLFLLPGLSGLLLFSLLPVLFSLGISFFEWDLLTPPVFVGFRNFQNLFTQDLIFSEVVVNTLFFCVTIVPLQMGLSLLLAVALTQRIRAATGLRVIYYMPVVTTIVAAAVIFQWIFDRNYGLFSGLIWRLGEWLNVPITPPDWFNSSFWARWAVVILTLWKNSGFTTVIFMAGLQGIPRVLYEAAAIDGAGRWKSFRHITLPMLSPTIFFLSVILIIGAFQLFGESFVMTGGGPGYATMTVVQYIYQSAFSYFRMGKGAALSWVLFAAIFALTLAQVRLQRKWVHYETSS
ncbi:MAG: carbohydrate ABC transporter permease [Candidatus Roseilinea sp.]|uniref:carbohydrate ABC transporter permease n=1 Tax=Candidatus Roseilinea sp. TaxID=2838777 RepID=UPI00404B6606